ncbi:chromosomal replication initiator protein DnaA [Phaeobacter gallaeciensis]|uniref:Chromosomal replication initiator protein DnaA n=1 Tax=Phaeobacter gallaeciensis TaxID=60890 RepID=A0AAC9Z517_9RHOB|nr:chromosomal replication initiator protein DnaA [Phaeobacter gallaeciensis]AHD07811.1 chromosomal replication initiator protein DnaA [Phaeobacter gallaeciensis DSM 26640]ATE91079.1 chromosomal replication initiator protein DnaA [Phaeobacter gallaeciensis]ATE95354.1 chromosomal replication initiator protein DnaA [Phaeobacter gallaeciensis]ATE99693.1 chromosomal replication initiator protein DnaA [Phaeobacter gallaeciensis]ATF04126.1 chromosomal replication initiator protein DnaA [Phaeobacter 
MTEENWGRLRQRLLKTVGQNNFTTWIEPLEFTCVENGVAIFNVPTNFMGNYVSQNFADLILHELNMSGEPVQRLAFRVAANTAARPAAVDSAGAADDLPLDLDDEALTDLPRARTTTGHGAAPKDQGETLQAAPLDPRFTFDSFVVGKPNELAHAAARRVAEGGPVTFNPLVLYGGVGLGKTHLMHAIAWELTARNPELNVLYLSAEQFMYRFVQALRERKMMDFKHLFRSVDVLMVDDVQFIAGKDSTQEEFFHTFNALVDQNKQIIISADRAPGEIKDLEDRVRSRLQCGLVVDLHPTDYELRLGILQSKVAQQMQTYPDLRIADGVLEFLAHRISTNVRVLEGALTRLFAFASLVGREIDMELTQDCLADVLRASERKITVEEIQRKVSEYYNIRMSDIIGPKRLRSYARPRQVAMYLCKQLTSRSLPEIGRRFGGRDHTTVMHGVRRIEELKTIDGQIAEDVEMLRRSLEA